MQSSELTYLLNCIFVNCIFYCFRLNNFHCKFRDLRLDRKAMLVYGKSERCRQCEKTKPDACHIKELPCVTLLQLLHGRREVFLHKILIFAGAPAFFHRQIKLPPIQTVLGYSLKIRLHCYSLRFP